MRPSLLSYAGCGEPHFLEACSLCQKSLGHNKDIFMYRGDTPFCSQECRQEQIERDEAKERRRWKVSSSSSSSSKRSSNKQSTEATKKSAVQSGTVAVA